MYYIKMSQVPLYPRISHSESILQDGSLFSTAPTVPSLMLPVNKLVHLKT